MSGVLSTLCSQERWSGFASSAWSLQNFLLCKGNCLSTRACRSLKTREIDDIDAAAPAVDQPVVLKCRVGDCNRRTLDAKNVRSEEHMSEFQSLMRHSYAVVCMPKHISTHNLTT